MRNARLALIVILLNLVAVAAPAQAEERRYGAVDLTGLARAVDWPYNPAGPGFAMVCNVNGPDGFLSIRSGPGSSYPAARKLNRLAIVEVDTRQRRGHWVRVLDAYRTHTKNGKRQAYKALTVQGWAHDGYLCAFLD